MTSRQVADPLLMAGEVVHLQRQSDPQVGSVPLRLPHRLDVFIQLIQPHSPVIEVVVRHG